MTAAWPGAIGARTGCPRSAIRLEGVGFTYPGRTEPVFRQLDLTIQAGRSLAIVGDNGAGKTTLVKLLARLYDPSAGRITVDGIDLRRSTRASGSGGWRPSSRTSCSSS